MELYFLKKIIAQTFLKKHVCSCEPTESQIINQNILLLLNEFWMLNLRFHAVSYHNDNVREKENKRSV